MESTAKYNVDEKTLIAEIYMAGFNQKSFCEEIRMERAKFSKKIKGLAPFKPNEIAIIRSTLNLSDAKTIDIFIRP